MNTQPETFLATIEAGHKPVKCEVIREYCGGKLYVEVLNDVKPNGQADYSNTDRYGATNLIHKSQIVQP